MAISHKAGQALSGLSHIAGQALSGLSHLAGQETSGGGSTCTLYTSNSTYVGVRPFAQYTTNGCPGVVFDDSSSGSICSVKFGLGGDEGDITVNDYYCEVWLLDGSRNMDTFIGRSDKVDGDSAWDYSLVTFAFSTPAAYDCTGSNEYGILFKQVDSGDAASTTGEADSTNWCRYHYNSSNTLTYSPARGIWDPTDNSIATEEAGETVVIEIWTLQ